MPNQGLADSFEPITKEKKMSRKGVLPQLLGLALVMLLVAGCGGESAKQTPITETATPTVSVGEIKGILASPDGSAGGSRELVLWETSCNTSGGWQKIERTGLATTSDESGAFLFEDVPPGCYTIQVTISGQGIPIKTGEGMALIEVLAGQTTDMGSIPLTRQ